MIKYVADLSRESIVGLKGVVSVPTMPIKGTTQLVEVQVRKVYCVSRTIDLPFNIEDASRREDDIEKASQAGEQLVQVNLNTRLNYRFLDMRTTPNWGIFHILSHVGNVFRQFLLCKGFVEIHTPRLIAGVSRWLSVIWWSGACTDKGPWSTDKKVQGVSMDECPWSEEQRFMAQAWQGFLE
jgi:aspartyl/asparaginyl-tRNA synthetase